MVVFSIGLPSRVAGWCDALVHALIERCLGSTAIVGLNTLEELATAVIRSPAPHLVASCRQPAIRLQSELVQAGRPFLVTLGDPQAVLCDLIGHGHSIADATRVVASSCAAIVSLVQAPHALVVAGSVDPNALAEAIDRHFGLGLSREEIAACAASAGVAPMMKQSGADLADQLGAREQAIIEGALVPFIKNFDGGGLEPIVWERELFFLHEDPPAPVPEPATRPVDVTGRGRVLIYGPAINLPPGNWSATMTLGFSAETAGQAFVVDVYAGRQLSSARLESAGAQVIDINLHFAIDDALDQRIEMRVLSERAAFDGRVALGQVILKPQGAVDDETRDYLNQVLAQ